VGWSVGVVVDRLVRDAQGGRDGDWLTGAQVAEEAGVGAARDLDPEAMPGPEPLRGGPQRDLHRPDPVAPSRPPVG
jgi:hypothetical protein